ncbi:hypothetical protein P0136_11770 [Lentisphaerota bacterium ZTH]|nr:hypothetical protein JYG24_10715 [Lentisphaerota bacterium]WET06034.1 hypothetical protein P0136_11770 [Lentisphaerota bacterium ZTH]
MFILCTLPVLCLQGEEAGREIRSAPPVKAKATVRIELEDATGSNQTLQEQEQLDGARREALKFKRLNFELQKDNKLLRKELIKILENFQTQNEKYRRLQLSIAATIASSRMQAASTREGQLCKSFVEVSDSGRALALKTIEFCDSVAAVVKDIPIGSFRKTELRLKIDALRRDARKLINIADLENRLKPVERCRVLAVNKNLQVVVLPVGSAHGAFLGLNYYIGKERTVAKIIAVRPFVSAAVVVKGSIENVAPGSQAATDVKTINKQFGKLWK